MTQTEFWDNRNDFIQDNEFYGDVSAQPLEEWKQVDIDMFSVTLEEM